MEIITKSLLAKIPDATHNVDKALFLVAPQVICNPDLVLCILIWLDWKDLANTRLVCHEFQKSCTKILGLVEGNKENGHKHSNKNKSGVE